LNSGSHPFAEKLKGSKLPLIIVGRDALTRPDSGAILQNAKTLASNTGVINS